MVEQGTLAWIPAEKLYYGWWWYLGLLPVPLALVLVAVLVNPRAVASCLALSSSDCTPFGFLYVWSFGVIVPAIAVLVTFECAQSRVAVSSRGVFVKTLLQRKVAKWTQLKWVSRVYKSQILVQYFPTNAWLFRQFPLSKNQARAVVMNACFPSELARPDLTDWVGASQPGPGFLRGEPRVIP